MTYFRTRSLLTALTVAASIGLPAQRAMAEDTGFYVGANVGRVLSTYRHADFDKGLNAAFGGEERGFTLGPSSVNKDHVMWSADVGYMMSRNFGVEASYLNLGSVRYSAFGTQAGNLGTSAVSANVETKSRGPALAVLGVLPMSELWELHARAGAYEGRTTSTYGILVDTNSSGGRLAKTSTSLLAGVGAALAVSTHSLLRLDYLHIDRLKDDAFSQSFNVDLVTAGVTFVF